MGIIAAYAAQAGFQALGAIATGVYQNYKQEQFYNQYQSPEARMRQMRAAGINPNAAAEGIAGASPSPMQATGFGSFDAAGQAIGDMYLAKVQKDNIEANTKNINQDTENKKTENDFMTASFSDRLDYLRNLGLISGEQYKQAQELTARYPELLDQNIEQIKSNIAKNDKEIEVYDQQISNLKKEIDKMDEEIRKMKADETLDYALAGEAGARKALEEAEKALTEKKTELAELEKKKIELGSDSNVEMKYRDIEKKQGKEAADKWLEGQYDILNKTQQAIEDANVMTKEQRNLIASYDKRIAAAEKYLDDCEQRYYKAGSVKKSWYKGELEAAQNRVNNLRKEKAEQLRRLGINESSSVHVGPVGTSSSK